MEEVYLSLGSNLGNRFGFLQKAKEGISATIGEIVKTSSIYETSSWGYTDPYLYLNQVIRVKTELSPTDILQNIRKIELENGRTRSSDGYTSRTIDIDILFFGNLIIEDDNIIIPHPRIPNRKFILAPLAEIDENFLHPRLNKTIGELLLTCGDVGNVVVYNE